MRSRTLASVMLAALLLAFLAPGASACPNCVNSIDTDAAAGSPGTGGSMAGGIGGSMAAGYYYSILFMLGMLFTVTGIFVFVVYRHARADTRMPLPEVQPPN